MSRHVEGPTAHSDSSAARGTANRKGVGKLKHLQVRSLWPQQARTDGQVKVDTSLNTADIGTKFLDAARRKQLEMLLLREHERRLERMVGGRSAKDVWRRWRGSWFEGMRYCATESTCGDGWNGGDMALDLAGCFVAREARRLQPGGVLTQTPCGPTRETTM